MTFNQLKGYFETYAAGHVAIKHAADKKGFVAVHTDASADGLVKKCSAPVIMVLISTDKKLMPPAGENFNWDKNTCFFLLKNCARKSETDITDAQSECEEIGDDFFAKLYKDRHTAIRGFQPESFVMQPVGPMFDDYYGQACMFNLVDECHPYVNPARWL